MSVYNMVPIERFRSVVKLTPEEFITFITSGVKIIDGAIEASPFNFALAASYSSATRNQDQSESGNQKSVQKTLNWDALSGNQTQTQPSQQSSQVPVSRQASQKQNLQQSTSQPRVTFAPSSSTAPSFRSSPQTDSGISTVMQVNRKYSNAISQATSSTGALISMPKPEMSEIAQKMSGCFENMSREEVRVYIKWCESIDISNCDMFKNEMNEKLSKISTRVKSKGVQDPKKTREYRSTQSELITLFGSLNDRLWSKSFSSDDCKWGAVILTKQFTEEAKVTLDANCSWKPRAKIAYYNRRGAFAGISFNALLTHILVRTRINAYILKELLKRGLEINLNEMTVSFPDPTLPTENVLQVYDPYSEFSEQVGSVNTVIKTAITSFNAADLALGLVAVNPLILFGTKEMKKNNGNPYGEYAGAMQKAMGTYFELTKLVGFEIRVPASFSFSPKSEFMALFYDCFKFAQRLMAMIEGAVVIKERQPRVGKKVMRNVVAQTQVAFDLFDFGDNNYNAPSTNMEDVLQKQRNADSINIKNSVAEKAGNLAKKTVTVNPNGSALQSPVFSTTTNPSGNKTTSAIAKPVQSEKAQTNQANNQNQPQITSQGTKASKQVSDPSSSTAMSRPESSLETLANWADGVDDEFATDAENEEAFFNELTGALSSFSDYKTVDDVIHIAATQEEIKKILSGYGDAVRDVIGKGFQFGGLSAPVKAKLIFKKAT